jgi:hypothetical protein
MEPQLRSLEVGDDPPSWRAAGFTVDDDEVRLGPVVIRLVGADEPRSIRGWTFAGIPEGSIDGLPTSATDDAPCEPASHPNGCLEIDHVVVLSPDSERTVAAFELAGFTPRRARETDQYGIPMVQTFFRSGRVIIELIAPLDGTGDDPASFFGLAYTVDDLDHTSELLGDALGSAKEAVQEGRRIATLRHKQLGLSVATAFMSLAPHQ